MGRGADEGLAGGEGTEVVMSEEVGAERGVDGGGGVGLAARARGAFSRHPELGLAPALLATVAAIHALDARGGFFSAFSLETLAHQVALFGCLAVGAAVVIISGGIDLSVGSVAALSSVLYAKLGTAWLPWAFGPGAPGWALAAGATAGTLLAGAGIGAAHAWMINRLHLPPFIATLASMAGLRSLAKILSEEKKIVLGEEFRQLGASMPTSLAIFAAVAVVVGLTMSRTRAGRHLYAVGGNEAAARLSGVDVEGRKRLAYTLSATLAALAGVLFTGKQGQGDATLGQAYELFAITSAVVGGCSLRGGFGTIHGTVLGLVLIQVIIKGTGVVIGGNEISLYGRPLFKLPFRLNSTQVEGLVLGIVIVCSVAFNQRLRRRG